MFDVGFTELFLLALIGLLVLGPERLPGLAQKIGSVLRQARQSWNVMKRTIEAEMARSGMDESVRQAQQNLRDIGRQVNDLPGVLQDAASKAGPAAGSAGDTATPNAPGEDAEAPTPRQADAAPDTSPAPGENAAAEDSATAGTTATPAATPPDPAPGNPATVPDDTIPATREEAVEGDERTRE